jgi:hypothetical protein
MKVRIARPSYWSQRAANVMASEIELAFDKLHSEALVPAHGLPGQVIIKNSNRNYDFGWAYFPNQVVTSLPAAGNAGRTVVLTSDWKIYRDNGTAWIRTVDGADVVGTMQNTGGSLQFDVTNGRIIFNNGSYMKVSGIGFGANSDLLEWFGPTQSNVNLCSRANAIYFLATDGASYFGGATASGSATGTLHTFTSSGTETLPAGKTSVTIELWGATGYGAHGPNPNTNSVSGGGGGSGGYARSTFLISALGGAGKTLTVSLATGASGTNSIISAGTATGFTTMTAPCGGNGVIVSVSTATKGGQGGLAGAIGSGGNIVNSKGNPGNEGDPTGANDGGSAVTGLYSAGNDAPGGSNSPTTNVAGKSGYASFYYT